MHSRIALGFLFAEALLLLGCRAADGVSRAADVYAAAANVTYLVLSDVEETEWGLEQDTLSGYGAGVGYREDGWVVTAGHVIDDARSIQIRAPDGSVRQADRWAWDGWSDVGVVHVPGLRVQVPKLGDPDRLKPGEPLHTFGAPRLLARPALSVGVVSALHRSFLTSDTDEQQIQDFIQTNAQLNPGNSGGGMFAADGALVGLATQSLSGFDKTPGISFGIPLPGVLHAARALVDQGEVDFGSLAIGIGVFDAWRTSESKKTDFRIDGPSGVIVYQVVDAGRQAGFELGDWIVAIDGVSVENSAHFEALIRFSMRGRPYRFGIRRRGVALEVPIELNERETSSRRGHQPEEWRTHSVVPR